MINQRKIIRDFNIVIDKFPKLHIKIDSKTGIANIFGEIDIFDSVGTYWDSFNISVRVGNNYPYEIPQVYELSSKIKREEKRHIASNGHCCIDLPHKLLIEARKGINIYTFFLNKIYPYFANQIFYEKKGYYVNGEWSHNFAGILEFYKNDLDIIDIALAIKFIELIILNKLPGRNDKCICGKGKYKNCHINAIEKLKMVGIKQLKEDLLEFKKNNNSLI